MIPVKKIQEIYIQPLVFRSITFHHQGLYSIKMSMTYKQGQIIHKGVPFIRQKAQRLSSAPGKEQMINNFNNFKSTQHSYKIDKQNGSFQTPKFQILYNDQTIIFDAGCLFVLEYNEQKSQKRNTLVKSSKINQSQSLKNSKESKIMRQSNRQSKISAHNEEFFSSKLTFSQISNVNILLQLIREETTEIKDGKIIQLLKPIIKKVSEEILVINVKAIQTQDQLYKSPYCCITFSTNQYFSSLQTYIRKVDFGIDLKSSLHHFGSEERMQMQQTSGIGCCQNSCKPKRKRQYQLSDLNDIYSSMIERKLNQYKTLRKWLIEQIIKFYMRRGQRSYDSSQASEQFVEQVINSPIADLEHVRVKYQEIRDSQIQMLPTSNFLLQTELQENKQCETQRKSLIHLLRQKYECTSREIYQHICEQSLLIHQNIRFIFERLIKISLFESIRWYPAILAAQKLKIKQISKHIEKVASCSVDLVMINRENTSSESNLRQIQQQPHEFNLKKQVKKHKLQVNQFLSKMPFYTLSDIKQPLVLSSRKRLSQMHSRSHRKMMVSEDRQSNIRQDQNSYNSILVVLVHGYKGNEFDLSKIKSYLNLYLDLHNFLSLRQLQEFIDESILELGKRAAKELSNYLSTKPLIKTINLIGFSLGGLILRAMLPHLEQAHRSKVNLLLTFASPHLGVSNIQSCLVKAGIFYLSKILKIKNIKELRNQKMQTEIGTLEQLANSRQLSKVKQVILVGSQADEYVPLYSALGQYTGTSKTIKKIEQAFNLRLRNVIKCNIWFDFQQTLWDKVTRRKGHITFLEDDAFLKYFFLKYKQYFYP